VRYKLAIAGCRNRPVRIACSKFVAAASTRGQICGKFLQKAFGMIF